MIADADFDRRSENKEDREADGDALELLTGSGNQPFRQSKK